MILQFMVNSAQLSEFSSAKYEKRVNFSPVQATEATKHLRFRLSVQMHDENLFITTHILLPGSNCVKQACLHTEIPLLCYNYTGTHP